MKQWQNLTDMFKIADVKDEMHKKYKNTILGITLDDNKTIFMIFIGYDDNGYFCFKDLSGRETKLAEDTHFQVFIPNPEKGLYNSPNGLLFFQRKPLRQWKRGLNKENASIHNIEKALRNENMIGIGGSNYFDSYWPYVTSTQDNASTTLDVALTMCTEESYNSYAINRTYGIVAHPQKPEGFILLHHTFHVGEVVGNEILVANKIFKQEILDTQAEWCHNYKVI